MKKVFRILFLLPLAAAAAETWLPPERPLPDLRELTGKGDVVAVSPKLGNFSPAAFESTLSLDGTWKLTPLETSEKPFGPVSSDELQFAQENFDDSQWNSIRVPLNWYCIKPNTYDKIFKRGEYQDPVSTGGNLIRGVVNSNVKGWYRRSFDIRTIPAKKRAVLSFERIGYQADLFINGVQVEKRHQGDFIPFEADVTELLKPGMNHLALRVCADIRPIHGRFPHTYGAMWGMDSYKGGIWGHVQLSWVGDPRIESVKLVTPASGELEIHAQVIHSGKTPLSVTPGISVVRAKRNATSNAREYESLTLQPGTNTLVFKFIEKNPEPWSFKEPNLYFATLFFRNGKEILSAQTTRFGFRDFEIRGTNFFLNGKETYLFFESAHSIHFGGYNSVDGNAIRPRERIGGYKKLGYNMLRTAHMPVPQEILDIADELGMMIYDEWSMCFVTGIDRELFEKNNLKELTKFITADHNHPSVVMWSLGNEVSHKLDPELPAQLDKQYDLVRELDLQRRPICTFAGMGDTECYGKAKLKTDLLDLHHYIGMTDSWTLTSWISDIFYKQLAAIYGDGKKFDKPYIISECVGGGWGYQTDPNYQSSVSNYLEVMKRSFHWGQPGSAGYSGAIGVAAASDPDRAWIYFQNRLGRRILEQFRLDHRYAGFAPWFADHKMASARVWNQEYYPGARLANSFAPRQLLCGTSFDLETFLLNEGDRELRSPKLTIALQIGNQEKTLGELSFESAKVGIHLFKTIKITIPDMTPGRGELKLTLYDDGQEVGRNSYAVTLHGVPAPLTDSLPVAVLTDDPVVSDFLKKMNIRITRVSDPKTLENYTRAIIGGKFNMSHTFERALRRWVEKGGFLLALECESGFVPAFSEYRFTSITAPLVEVVVPGHPVFAGLHLDDFDVWAENKHGFVATSAITPMDETLLAANGIFTHNRKVGAVLSEGGFGKGRLLISNFDALKIVQRNGSAAKYLENLIHYFASPQSTLATPVQLTPKERAIEYSADMSDAKFVDLRPYANRSFFDAVAGDGKGGWTDQGDNDFRNLPHGKQKDAGVLFDLIDPALNNGNGGIMLGGRGWPQGPSAVKNIAFGNKARTLYFLHTGTYMGDRKTAGYYQINYDDNTHVCIKIEPDLNISDWWAPNLPELAFPAFARSNGVTNNVTFFVAAWENPVPTKAIRSIDFVSSGSGANVVLAGVTYLPVFETVNIIPFYSGKIQWYCGSEGGKNKAASQLINVQQPIGKQAMQVNFPATESNAFPFVIVPVSLAEQKERIPTHFSILFRSNSEGIIDVQIPEKDWHGCLTLPLDLGLSRGEWVRIRFDLKKDAVLSGTKFELSNLRNEIGLFNGKERRFGFPRKAVSCEIGDLCYEFQSNTKK